MRVRVSVFAAVSSDVTPRRRLVGVAVFKQSLAAEIGCGIDESLQIEAALLNFHNYLGSEFLSNLLSVVGCICRFDFHLLQLFFLYLHFLSYVLALDYQRPDLPADFLQLRVRLLMLHIDHIHQLLLLCLQHNQLLLHASCVVPQQRH